MQFIQIKRDFKHHGQQYFAGEVRKLSKELCDYFAAAGWAGDSHPPKSPPDPVTLNVQSVRHGLKSSAPGSP
jgi:hypothetical protein